MTESFSRVVTIFGALASLADNLGLFVVLALIVAGSALLTAGLSALARRPSSPQVMPVLQRRIGWLVAVAASRQQRQHRAGIRPTNRERVPPVNEYNSEREV